MRSQLSLIGKKEGMMHVFDKNGNLVACSVISVDANVVAQLKTASSDGYNAVQIGADVVQAPEKTIEKRFSKALLGHFKKSGGRACRVLKEVVVSEEAVQSVSLGDEFGLEIFDGVSNVDICGISKGKGFQGVMKKFGFRGGPKSHGSGFHRHAGSIGMRSTPGRCFPGSKRPSHMGCDRVTVKNLEVVKVDLDRKVMLVKGAIPGFKGSVVVVKRSCGVEG
ncbi:50S ribosomal protein L3 [Chlamydia trachomatis]|uniref:Large ribosomal subunit protein uL3 n=2 Tax=Chlamydia trachomatis TaxID=813 RepID=RL3_CHLT2|nr:50S ribosomal protein L3 [Chlamydia trachomatis]B0B8A2.1 RecName: Full=Large ribosomal subunit protein uL3; AltName: Full=50S ribosomal protein L3 [Chlamydia trachomatis 434/Bu]B0BCG7.1 RecName: Full=Large ribosomal subunit protein uL3; AltName: Full=50S ribosomal protein L3 [Chlamydia trachomatis L2b/UCH-1/proctitis]AEJ77576.1 50S ribosomal protein L3 [Chlamydia trachomatis L2c]AGJ64902.1 50S ribosomal protein L3 [Chlamydia trachomatis L2/434/Bu(i)]AGJ65843.1 50S ribosomal protein L3 [Chla